MISYALYSVQAAHEWKFAQFFSTSIVKRKATITEKKGGVCAYIPPEDNI
jgi:hypothetical protein